MFKLEVCVDLFSNILPPIIQYSDNTVLLVKRTQILSTESHYLLVCFRGLHRADSTISESRRILPVVNLE